MADETNDITDLATLGDLEGTIERPKTLDRDDLSGTEGITQDEIKLPRLAIAQGLSPQVIASEGKYIKNLSVGQMFNDVTEDIYGTGPIKVVPILRHVTRIEFDQNDRKVPLDRNVPAGDPRLDWHGDEPPRATEFVEFVCILLQPGKAPTLVVVSIKTTNKEMREAAKLWTTYIATRQAAIYAGFYNLFSKIITGKNKQGQSTMYGVFIVKNAGFIPKDNPAGNALFDYAKRMHEQLKGKRVVTEREGEEDGSFDTATMEAESKVGGM